MSSDFGKHNRESAGQTAHGVCGFARCAERCELRPFEDLLRHPLGRRSHGSKITNTFRLKVPAV